MSDLICDLHVHSRFSVDSSEQMESCCESAIRKGVDVLCFTDHIDFCEMDSGYGFYDEAGYFSEIERVREKYGKKLKILSGVEFSEPHLYPQELANAHKKPYDFIMGSIHYWYFDRPIGRMIADGVPVSSSYEHYWHEAFLAAQAGGFDCFGHFDFPKRYHKESAPEFAHIVTICSELVKNGICLEINTSSLRKNAPGSMPDRDLLSIYKSCGGKYLTIGSDAHRADDIAADNRYAKQLIKYFGFEEVYFSGRKRINFL